jgi:gas vesicle protein
MSSAVALESIALREKLLYLLKKGIPQGILDDIRWLIEESGKGAIVVNKLNNILDETKQDILLYSYLEWPAAYVIAHEQKTLKELIEKYESSFIKHKHNRELSDRIRNMIYNLNELTYKFTVEIKEIRNDNVYDDVIKNIEKTSSIIRYLVNALDEIEKENKQLLEEICASRESIQKTVISILENL